MNSNGPNGRIVFKGGLVIDGTGSLPAQVDFAVEGDRISAVNSTQPNDRIMDVSGHWILPGLIDCHIHAMVERFDILEIIETPFSLAFFHAARNLERTLGGGVTTARDLGGADMGVKRAVADGLIEGPDLQISVNIISMTGGHGDHWSICGYETPDLLTHPGRPSAVCDGVEEITRVAREMIRAGADVLKVCTTGGLLSPRDDPFTIQFLEVELERLVAIASDAKKGVVAHAQSPEGIKRAIRSGIRSIEHGFYLDKESVTMMVDEDVFLVPTMMAPHGVIELAAGRRESEVAMAREVVKRHRDSIALAIDAGVKIAMGSDAGAITHGTNRRELLHLVEAGMSPIDAIKAGTLVSSQNLGMAEDRGILAPGMKADFIVSSIDPISRLKEFCEEDEHLRVWKSGRLFQPREMDK